MQPLRVQSTGLQMCRDGAAKGMMMVKTRRHKGVRENEDV